MYMYNYYLVCFDGEGAGSSGKIFDIKKTVFATEMSISAWMVKGDVIYIYIYTLEYYFIKKNEILPFANNTVGRGGYYAQ